MWQELHARILDLVRDYHRARHGPRPFLPGQSRVPYAGRVFDDEELAVAAGFPTTVAPLVQHGLVPVFVDVDPETANVLADRLADAVGPRTRAVMLAHTLGNPFDLDAVLDLVRRHDLYLVEDNC